MIENTRQWLCLNKNYHQSQFKMEKKLLYWKGNLIINVSINKWGVYLYQYYCCGFIKIAWNSKACAKTEFKVGILYTAYCRNKKNYPRSKRLETKRNVCYNRRMIVEQKITRFRRKTILRACLNVWKLF